MQTLSILEFTIFILIISIPIGIFGILVGLGGGIFMIPILTFFGVDIHYAMGGSLISIITLSLGASITKSSQQYTNIKVGVFLETGAAIGAVVGAFLLTQLPVNWIALLFGLILLLSAYLSMRRNKLEEAAAAEHAQLKGIELGKITKVKLFQSWLIIATAGVLSGVFGIGSGTVKVIAMDQVLRLPYKISTATSNFMIGMTAAASIGVYFANDYFNFTVTFPVVVGIFIGTLIGSKMLHTAKTRQLRWLLVGVLVLLGFKMLHRGMTGILS